MIQREIFTLTEELMREVNDHVHRDAALLKILQLRWKPEQVEFIKIVQIRGIEIYAVVDEHRPRMQGCNHF